MYFRSHRALALFVEVAQHGSYSAAAQALNLTKGAVSQQIKLLESDLGFSVFRREARGISLTASGAELLRVVAAAHYDIQAVIQRIRHDLHPIVTVGVSTYFASRWLSPRLMRFTSQHPKIGLRVQPVMGSAILQASGIDLHIQWCDLDRFGSAEDTLFKCAAIPTACQSIARNAKKIGIAAALQQTTLLHDQEDSLAWRQWYGLAGLDYNPKRDDLVIDDPNVRVQAVIDGQGVALNDRLVESEIAAGTLVQLSGRGLESYGYRLVPRGQSFDDPSIIAFTQWLKEESLQF